MFRLFTRKVRQSYQAVALKRKFRTDFQRFFSLSKETDTRFAPAWEDRFPCLADSTATTDYDRHYVLHTGWAARVLAQTRPTLHIDIGSSLYFVAIASAIVPVKFYDYRPAHVPLDAVETAKGDLTKLSFSNQEVSSVSCMHVLEHVGLGRYGDPLDPAGDLKAARELQRVVAPHGQLLMVLPVGRPRVMFNAHRIYSYGQVLAMFSELRLQQFSLIPDDTKEPELIIDASPERVQSQNYGCGCFWFRR